MAFPDSSSFYHDYRFFLLTLILTLLSVDAGVFAAVGADSDSFTPSWPSNFTSGYLFFRFWNRRQVFGQGPVCKPSCASNYPASDRPKAFFQVAFNYRTSPSFEGSLRRILSEHWTTRLHDLKLEALLYMDIEGSSLWNSMRETNALVNPALVCASTLRVKRYYLSEGAKFASFVFRDH